MDEFERRADEVLAAEIKEAKAEPKPTLSFDGCMTIFTAICMVVGDLVWNFFAKGQFSLSGWKVYLVILVAIYVLGNLESAISEYSRRRDRRLIRIELKLDRILEISKAEQRSLREYVSAESEATRKELRERCASLK